MNRMFLGLVALAVVCVPSAVNAQGLDSVIGAYRNGNIIARSGFVNQGYRANANIIRNSGGVDPGSAIIYGLANARSIGVYRSQPYGYGGQVFSNRAYVPSVRSNHPRGTVIYRDGTQYHTSPGYNVQPSHGPSYAPVYGGNSIEAHNRHAETVNNLYRNLGYQDGVGGFDSSAQYSRNISPR